MMAPPPVVPSAMPPAHRIRLPGPRWLVASALGLLAAAAGPPAAQAQAAWVPFPSQATLREVQLAALACARDNTAETCKRSRSLADPLLDHPRLPASCKDLLWSLSERSTPAPSNSFTRREALVAPAQSLLAVCRSREKPPEPAPSAQPGGSGSNSPIRLNSGGN